MRILMVTAMWPSLREPHLGSFLVPLARELESLGHELELASISRRGGLPTKYARLAGRAVSAGRRRAPDVVFAHFLFPPGAIGAAVARAFAAPLVVMAHGQDVANLARFPGVTAATRRVIGRAAGVIVNSRWLADRLTERIPVDGSKLEIIDCGVDLAAFAPQSPGPARRELGWEEEGPAFLCVGTLIERKNVMPLADAFERIGGGRLAFVGDGPLRDRLEGRARVRVTGLVEQAVARRWIAACDVLCQPSLVEPFGQATLEAMAMERNVVATTVGGPPEFVPPEAGVLVHPRDREALLAALERAAAMPTPNPAAREAAAEHDVRRQATRMAAVLERAVGERRS
jgi:glycosyltransferase involved in cell wall biosynthesis